MEHCRGTPQAGETELETIKGEKTTLEKHAKDLEKTIAAGGDVEELKKAHAAELQTIREKADNDRKEMVAREDRGLIDSEAGKFAAAHFTTPRLIKREFADRLTVDRSTGDPVLRVLDSDGKPSIHGVGDLQKEFLDDKEFSGIIKANPGSGSGATKSDTPKAGGQGGGKDAKEMDLSSASPKSLVESLRGKVEASED